ncbi:MAG: glgX [Hyphomicrobiales bacterium]|nr:glgX [Hyphomicrobiales bacterium]
MRVSMSDAAALARAPARMGVHLVDGGAEAAVFSSNADEVFLCVFDAQGGQETRWRLKGRDGDVFHGFVPGVAAGARYGLRASGPYAPEQGHWFDVSKLLVDPYATRIDRPYALAPEFSRRGAETAGFAPRCVIEPEAAPLARLAPQRPRLIYEMSVRTFSKRNPDVPEALRGTLAGLAHPASVAHLTALGVSHVELMPITAWMTERHLVPLGLENVWGYNPVGFMALDPRLAPGGLEDLRAAVQALHAAGIAVLLDVVFNHTAEGDEHGPTLSLRGLDNAVYYRHVRGEPGAFVNDTGCGNTLACDRAPVVRLLMDSMRHFVERAGIDGFRFDLAPIMGRSDDGFSPEAPLLTAMRQDPVLSQTLLIAEPWDVGPGGYQLGAFPAPFLEWNDRWRDDVRRFWRGDAGMLGALATRLSGSQDVFGPSRRRPSTSVDFIAAHDGFTLRDLVSWTHKRNEPNGEQNRDGTNENYSWNNGAEGPGDEAVEARRTRDVRALMATLMLSSGSPMLTAGDEFGRTQHGDNNAYCQDNEMTWLDWEKADRDLARYFGGLVRLRATLVPWGADAHLTGAAQDGAPFPDATWLTPDGHRMTPADWNEGDALVLVRAGPASERVLLAVNRSQAARALALPAARPGCAWGLALDSAHGRVGDGAGAFDGVLPPRAVLAFVERSSG